MAAILQGVAWSTASIAPASTASASLGSANGQVASHGKVFACPAFFGSLEGLSRPGAAGRDKQKAPAGIQVSATGCQPDFVVRRMRPAYDRRRAARAAQAAAMLSPWAAFDCMPGVQFKSSGRRSVERFHRDPISGLNWFLEELLRELPRGMADLRRGQGWDVEETEDAWVLRFELPGFGAEDVQVQVEDGNILSIRAKLDEGQESERFRSRRAGSFETRLRMPDMVRIDGIEADLKKGILAVVLPKMAVEEAKPTVISINVKNAAGEASRTSVKMEAVNDVAPAKASSSVAGKAEDADAGATAGKTSQEGTLTGADAVPESLSSSQSPGATEKESQ